MNRMENTLQTTGRLAFCAAIFGLMTLSAGAAAQDDVPPSELTWNGDTGAVGFSAEEYSASVFLVTASGDRIELRTITNTDDALAVLADTRLRPVWAALTGWAGPGLERLRDLSEIRAEQIYREGLEPNPTDESMMSSYPKDFIASSQYAQALLRSGKYKQAIGLLEGSIDEREVHSFNGRRRRQKKREINEFLNSIRKISIAEIVFENGDAEGAINYLDQFLEESGLHENFKINIETNLALMLARNGQYDQALRISQTLEPRFEDIRTGFLSMSRKSPDAVSWFDAIHACALNGVGRSAEATAIVGQIPRQVPDTARVPKTNTARNWAFSCMRDPEGLADELVAQLEAAPPGSDLFVIFQPDADQPTTERDTYAAALQDEGLKQAIAGRVKALGPEFSDALGHWQAEP